MKLIRLSTGEDTMVDDDNYDALMRFTWYFNPNRSVCRGKSVRRGEKWGSTTIAITADILGKRDGWEIDHKNRNPLDNRKQNLRFATRQENCRNRIRRNTSGFPGVWLDYNHYIAGISWGKDRMILPGRFKTAEEAFAKYRAANLKLFGEFSPFYEHAL